MISEILNVIKIDDKIISLYEQKINLPATVDFLFEPFGAKWFPHPPVLVPIFIDYGAPAIRGVLVHHFTKKRNITHVLFNLDSQFLIEYARNVDQFFLDIILFLLELEGDVSEEIIDLCNEIKLFSITEISALDYDIYSKNYRIISTLKDTTPLCFCNSIEEYNGDFLSSVKMPHNEDKLNTKVLFNSCGYELVDDSLITSLKLFPDWLSDKNDKKDLFDFYFRNDELDKAWFTLNSKNWSVSDLANCLERLMLKSNDKVFHLICNNWLNGYRSAHISDEYRL